MIIVICKHCGKHCKVKTIKINKGEVNPNDFYCRVCHCHHHKTVSHPDMSVKHKIEFYAALRRSQRQCTEE